MRVIVAFVLALALAGCTSHNKPNKHKPQRNKQKKKTDKKNKRLIGTNRLIKRLMNS